MIGEHYVFVCSRNHMHNLNLMLEKMIKIDIKPVKRDKGIYSDAAGISLPNIDKAREIIEQSLLKHPFKEGILDEKITIIAYVTVGGDDYSDIFDTRWWSSIDYSSYPAVVLNLHLVRYMGDYGDYAVSPPEQSEVILNHKMNCTVLQYILYHEFGHFLDVIDPDFKYDHNIREQFRKEEKAHKIFMHIWDAYINRRLVNILGEEYEKCINPSKGSSKNHLGKLVRSIWSNKDTYTFPQLIQRARECSNRPL